MGTPFDLHFYGAVQKQEVRIPTVAETHFPTVPLTCGNAAFWAESQVRKVQNHD